LWHLLHTAGALNKLLLVLDFLSWTPLARFWVLPFIVIVFCWCSSVFLELFPFLIHFACLWHVSCGKAPSGVYVMSSLCIQRCNLLQIYATTNQNKTRSCTTTIYNLSTTLPLTLTVSFSLGQMPLATRIVLCVNANPIDIAATSHLSPLLPLSPPLSFRWAFNLSQDLCLQHICNVLWQQNQAILTAHSIQLKNCRVLERKHPLIYIQLNWSCIIC